MSPLTPEQQEEVEKAFAASRALQAAMAMERRKKTGELEIELVGAIDDPPVPDPSFQSELDTFSGLLPTGGVAASQRAMAFDSMDAHGYPLAKFIIRTLGPPAIGIVTAGVSGWFAGRAGRKAKLKFGEIEAEARTPEEVEQLLRSAAAFRDSIGKADKEE